MSWTARPLRLSTAADGFEAAFKARLHVSEEANAAIEKQVRDIVAQVRHHHNEDFQAQMLPSPLPCRWSTASASLRPQWTSDGGTSRRRPSPFGAAQASTA